MRVGETVRLGLDSAVWRLTGSVAAGRRLLRALRSSDPTVRTLAGMQLVRGGRRAEPLLREALDRRETLPLVLTLLGDVGTRGLEPELLRFSRDADPAVAESARQALRVLQARHRPAREDHRDL